MSERRPPRSRRMPKDSTFYDRVVPIILIALGALTLLIILVAVGVLLGIVHWQ
ncbi:MAG: hypothetical protein LC737_10800 [Chloroflexi bacterium]|nr:hypothetical protein [Chloroflexota bacterium]